MCGWLLSLSGEEVRNHVGKPVGMMYAWWAGFDRVWRDVYSATGGRIRQMVLRLVVVNESNALRMRWWDLLSRSEARESTAESPCHPRCSVRFLLSLGFTALWLSC